MISKHQKPVFIAALSAGALWGIFECTFGYILHLLPVSLGFLIWYPAACFFLTTSYKESAKPGAILLTAVIASAMKLLNLMLPGRIDRIINPAVSIILEGIAVWMAVIVFLQLNPKKRLMKAVLVFGADSLWRLLFTLYLAALAPGWIRDISVISQTDMLFRFLIIENLLGSFAAWSGYLVFKRIKSRTGRKIPVLNMPAAGITACLLVTVNIGLQFLLNGG